MAETGYALAVQQPERLTRDDRADPAGDLGEKRRKFRAYETNKERELREAQVARRYYHGKQWTDDEIARLNRRGQPVVTDNRIARKVDFLVGVEQRMRRDPKAYPRTPADEQSADTATAGLRFVCDTNRWEQKASDGAHDGMVSGIGVVWVGIEGGRDGPNPKMKSCQVDRFFYDPRSVLPDFSDARYMGMHLWIDIEEAVAEFPDQAKELEHLVDRTGGLTTMKLEEDRSEQWGDFERKRIRLVEMYEKKPMAPAAQGFGWYYCKFSGDISLESMWSPYLDENGMPDCPYVAWSPYVDEKGDRYGLVRNMRPMQDEINHRRSKLLHRVNVRQVQMKTGIVEDVDHTRTQLARPDGIIEHNGVWGEDIGIIDQSQEIRGEAELLAQAQSSLENLGPNPGLVGKGGGIADQSGRAILAQRDSGMTELSPVFERLRDWKLRVYRKSWCRIKQAWTGERWIRITGEDDAPKFIGLNQYQTDPMTGRITGENVIAEIDVDIILEEGPDTITMQEELMQTFSQMGEVAAGPLGKVMIELSAVPNKERLMKMIDEATQPDPAVAQMNQRMADLEAMLKEATVAKTHAETEGKRIDGLVKLAQAMIPPQAVQQMYPIPFADAGMAGQQGGMMPPGGPQQMPPDMPPEALQAMQGQPEQMSPDGGLPLDPAFAAGAPPSAPQPLPFA